MGYFKNLEIDVIEMYREDGMKEREIAKSLGIDILQVHQILAKYESDQDESEVVSYDDLTFEPNEDFNAEHY